MWDGREDRALKKLYDLDRSGRGVDCIGSWDAGQPSGWELMRLRREDGKREGAGMELEERVGGV